MAPETKTYAASGGNRLDGTTRRNLIETYRLEERGGWVFWIDAHKRATARLISSRYDGKKGTESNVWSGHYVGVWTSNHDVVEDVEETIPAEELTATIRGVTNPDKED